MGRDIIDKSLMQMNIPDYLVTNPLTGSLSMKTMATLSGGKVSKNFRFNFARLLETGEKAAAGLTGSGNAAEEPSGLTGSDDAAAAGKSAGWWVDAVFYQIYPRSFADNDGDGRYNLRGIIGKLDYLKELGIDCIWLSPIYDSPDDDNGYDIRDYRKIDTRYGDMADFDNLLTGIHSRGMRLIMDLVINHTSDEHVWFQSALAGGDSPCRDYYLIREGGVVRPHPPNNWTSLFSGPAWNHYPDQNLWAMHLFSKKQIDLNWESPAMRSEIYAMIRWWLEKGVDGFRLDVVNFISKADGLPDGDTLIGEVMGYRGIEHYFFGPRLMQYLNEMRREAFEPFQAFTVGETPGVGLNMSKLLTSPGHLDLVFGFDHLENPGKTRFDEYAYDLNFLKKYLIKQAGILPDAALYFENHDNPRMPSKIDPSGRYCTEISCLLALMLMTLPGTPFIFQGQELGEINADFKNISDVSDVESLGLYKELIGKGTPEPEAFRKILAGTRDHARKPVDWGKAAENQVLNCYKTLIKLRKQRSELTGGKTTFLFIAYKDYFCYIRKGNSALLMECNLGKRKIKSRVKKLTRPAPLYSTYAAPHQINTTVLQPYEGRVYELV